MRDAWARKVGREVWFGEEGVLGLGGLGVEIEVVVEEECHLERGM